MSKSFEKKAVTDLKVIEELDLVICLSEGALSTHKLNDNYKTLNVFNKYKAISSFGCYVEEVSDKRALFHSSLQFITRKVFLSYFTFSHLYVLASSWITRSYLCQEKTVFAKVV